MQEVGHRRVAALVYQLLELPESFEPVAQDRSSPAHEDSR